LPVGCKTGSGPEATAPYERIEDPYQMKNAADSAPDIVRHLTEEELIPWLQKTRDPWRKS
jgi:hypothetical protein